MTDAKVAAWRKGQRAALMAARAVLLPEQHGEASERIDRELTRLLPTVGAGVVSVYWPVRGEVSVLPFAERYVAGGGKIALPVVGGREQPLLFREWSPGCPMREGALGIPSPAEGPYVQPQVLLVPLLGFDAAGYRLGYGGGYYDRTLASLPVKPRTVGIGFELGRLATIYPQPFDVPMDCIVTEAGVWRRGL